MKFSEAMEKLSEGSKVSRHFWKDSVYFKIVEGVLKSFQPVLLPYIYNDEIMLSDGWLIDGDNKEYKFSEIIPFLQQGAKAKLKEWDETFIYLDHPTKSLVAYSMNNIPYTPDFESFIAQDWIEI